MGVVKELAGGLRRAGFLVGWALGAVLTSGCAAAHDSEPSDDPVATESAELTRLASFTDWSGLVRVTYYLCGWSAKSSNPRATCTVPDEDAIVGGGAEIEGDAPGALLVASYPSSAQTWVAESKDHGVSAPHRVRARAIGLRLEGISGPSLRGQLMITRGDGPTGADSVAFAGVPMAETILVGGGARASYSGVGHLLYDSEPSVVGFDLELNGWWAGSKDHVTRDRSGRSHSYAIWLPRCPSGFAGGCLESTGMAKDEPNVSGYVSVRMARADFFADYAVTSVGGWARWTGAGRLLAQLYPYSGSTGAPSGRSASTDHQLVDASGLTRAVLILLRTAR